MKTRTDLLNHLAEKYNLQRYLEIGVQDPAQNFDKIISLSKCSVDPDPNAKATYCMTSDDFFLKWWTDIRWVDENELLGWNPDIVFIDGLHTAEQVKKDFENALNILSPNGFIVLHDCNPEKEEHTIVPRPTERGHWNGDVYRFALYLTYPHPELTPNERPFVVDIDNGCLVYSKSKQVVFRPFGLSCISWQFFNKTRRERLNLISWEEFIKL